MSESWKTKKKKSLKNSIKKIKKINFFLIVFIEAQPYLGDAFFAFLLITERSKKRNKIKYIDKQIKKLKKMCIN